METFEVITFIFKLLLLSGLILFLFSFYNFVKDMYILFKKFMDEQVKMNEILTERIDMNEQDVEHILEIIEKNENTDK